MTRTLMLAAAAVLAVAGCGGSNEQPAAEPTTTSAPTSAEPSTSGYDSRTLNIMESWWEGGTEAQHDAFCLQGPDHITSFADDAYELDPSQDVYTITMFLLDKCDY